MAAPKFPMQDQFPLHQDLVSFDFSVPLPPTPHLPTPPTHAFYHEKPETAFEHIMVVPMANEVQIRSFTIQGLLLVSHEVINPAPGQTRSDWSFYFLVGSNRFITMSPCITANRGLSIPHGRRGNLIVHATTSEYFLDAQQICRVSTHPLATINDILNTIVRSGRHRFEFDANGRGGRGWILDIIDLLQRVGVISVAAEAAKAREVLHIEWSRSVPRAIRVPIFKCGYQQ